MKLRLITKNLIFELRSQLYAWYHVALKSGKEEMPIKNKEKLKRVWEISAKPQNRIFFISKR